MTSSGTVAVVRPPPVAVQCLICSRKGRLHSPCLTQPSTVEGKSVDVDVDEISDELAA